MSHKSDLIATDIIQYLKNHENKELLRFITCGSVDDGKSTLIGRLLHDSKLIYEDQLMSIRKKKMEKGGAGSKVDPDSTKVDEMAKPSTESDDNQFDLAAIVDGLQAEQEQGITIDVAYRFFSTDKRKFIIADTPGHEQYTRNMATGASNAELAVILIDAQNGVLTQTRRHSYIVNLMGIRDIIVTINKMDAVSYEKDVFDKIKADYLDFAANLGMDVEGIRFVPLSALEGDNVVDASEHMPWYHGPTLMEILETTKAQRNVSLENFRLPVQYVLRPDASFRGYSGTIASGIIRRGEDITVLPSRKTSQIASIVTYDGELEQAQAPMAVTLTLADELDISRGDLLVKSENIPEVSDRFDALVVWMSEHPLQVGKVFNIKRASTVITGHVEEIYYKVDMKTLEQREADKLDLNEIGYCRLHLSTPIAYDTYHEHPQTGSFIFIDRLTNNTVAAGMIRERQKSRNVVWHKHSVDQQARSRLKGHKPAVIWLTGLSGSGKSTIANALEVRLNQSGGHTFLLDGDNLRHGLNQDLGFSEQDRHENIRRIGEVSALFVKAGLIAITSFISPYRSDRQIVRSMVEDQEFVEVFIDTPLEECEKRDPKGLYKRARSGEISGFTGIDSPYEQPEEPEVTIQTAELSVAEAVEKIYKYLTDNKILYA